MTLEVCWDGLWTLSFGLSKYYGHGSWLLCEATLSARTVSDSCLMTPNFRPIPIVKLLGILLRNRCWQTCKEAITIAFKKKDIKSCIWPWLVKDKVSMCSNLVTCWKKSLHSWTMSFVSNSKNEISSDSFEVHKCPLWSQKKIVSKLGCL